MVGPPCSVWCWPWPLTGASERPVRARIWRESAMTLIFLQGCVHADNRHFLHCRVHQRALARGDRLVMDLGDLGSDRGCLHQLLLGQPVVGEAALEFL